MFNLRGCTLGQCLTDAIDEMDQQGLVTSQLRDQILQQFDKVHFFKELSHSKINSLI